METLAPKVVDVLGVRFHRISQSEAVEHILHWIAEQSPRMVITAGPEFVMQTNVDEELRTIAKKADLVTADGIGVVWAAERLGRPVPERVTGVELVISLLEEAKRRNQSLRIYLLGATEESLAQCIGQFREAYPLCEFAGRSGYFKPNDIEDILQEINEFAPNLWLVGIGQPRQEKLIFEHLNRLTPCVAMGIGGSIDAWSGNVRRAPEVFQKLNLEWFYRLVKQPSRWRRQLALPRFAMAVLQSRGSSRRRSS